MVTLTGTPVKDTDWGVSGSQALTIPADATGIVIMSWSWIDGVAAAFDELNFADDASLGGTLIVTNTDDTDPYDMFAHIITSADAAWPGTGSHTLYWSFNSAPTEGGTVLIFFVKGIDTINPVRATDSQKNVDTTWTTDTMGAAEAGDLSFIAVATYFNTANNAVPSGYAQTLLDSGANDHSVNWGVGYEQGEDAMVATSQTATYAGYIAFVLRAEAHYYLDTGASGVNDGSSWTDAWESWDDMIADLTALTAETIIHVRRSGAGGKATRTTYASAFGWSGAYNLTIEVEELDYADTEFDDTKATFLLTSGGSHLLTGLGGNLTIRGLQFERYENNRDNGSCLQFVNPGARTVTVEDCYFKSDTYGASSWQYGIMAYNVPGFNLKVSNCIFDGFKNGVVSHGGIYWNGTAAYFYNNLFVNCYTGIYQDENPVVRNCLFSGNTYDELVDGTNFQYCATTAASIPGSNNRVSQTFTFVSGTDFALDAADAGAKDYGTDLSGDTYYPITTDMVGTVRSGDWDIGPFEYVAAGGTAYYRTIEDGVGITDALTHVVTYIRSKSESIGITDAFTRVGTYIRSKSESIGITDIASSAIFKLISIADTIGVTDALTRVGTYIRSINESISVTDIFARVGTFFRSINDALGITDSLSASILGSIKYLSLSDSIGVTDVLSTAIAYSRSIDDSVGVTDILTRAAGFSRSIIESVTLSDAFVRTGSYIRLIDESVGLTDSLSISLKYFVYLASTIGVTDTLRTAMNAIIPMLLNLIGNFWTRLTRTTNGYDEVNRSSNGYDEVNRTTDTQE